MEIMSICPKCKNPLSPPEQSLLQNKRQLICRKCGTNLSIYFRSNTNEITPAGNNDHFCISCPFFQFGYCSNKEASIMVKEIEIKLIGKTIENLPKGGCKIGNQRD